MLHRGSTPTLLGLAISIAILFAGHAPARGDPPKAAAPPFDAEVERGLRLFGRYCSSCHGVNGKGDGLIADALTPRPADLTAIAARRRGNFPVREIEQIIDGRALERVHGSRTMPVWGERFGEEVNARPATKQRVVEARLALLTKYLEAIQKK